MKGIFVVGLICCIISSISCAQETSGKIKCPTLKLRNSFNVKTSNGQIILSKNVVKYMLDCGQNESANLFGEAIKQKAGGYLAIGIAAIVIGTVLAGSPAYMEHQNTAPAIALPFVGASVILGGFGIGIFSASKYHSQKRKIRESLELFNRNQ